MNRYFEKGGEGGEVRARFVCLLARLLAWVDWLYECVRVCVYTHSSADRLTDQPTCPLFTYMPTLNPKNQTRQSDDDDEEEDSDEEADAYEVSSHTTYVGSSQQRASQPSC